MPPGAVRRTTLSVERQALRRRGGVRRVQAAQDQRQAVAPSAVTTIGTPQSWRVRWQAGVLGVGVAGGGLRDHLQHATVHVGR